MRLDLSIKQPDVAKHLGKARNRIAKIGIELEGGWDKLPQGSRLVHDGSVTFPNLDRQGNAIMQLDPWGNPRPVQIPGPKHKGELPSTPLEPGKWASWVKQFYPSHVNDTCGLHVHLSFRNNMIYQRLMDPLYPTAVVEYLTLWAQAARLSSEHPIWGRLSGKHIYCAAHYYAPDQARANSKHDERRRTVINYCHALHSTLECRLLPMMDTADQACEAIQRFIDITNAWLLAYARREEAIDASLHVDDDTFGEREELRECV